GGNRPDPRGGDVEGRLADAAPADEGGREEGVYPGERPGHLLLVLLRDAEAVHCALEGGLRAGFVDLLGRRRREAFLGALLRLLGALDVDLGGLLGALGQEDRLFGGDLHEAAGGREVLLALVAADGDHAGLQGAQQRRVAGQDAEIAALGGDDQRLDFLREDELLRGDDL